MTYLHDTRLARYTIRDAGFFHALQYVLGLLTSAPAFLHCLAYMYWSLLTSAHGSSKPPLNVMCTAW